MEQEELITTPEAAAILGIKYVAFSKWMNGHIPNKGAFEIQPAIIVGRAYLWRRSEVEAFAAKLVGNKIKVNPNGCARYYDCDAE
jgi:predicted DNA-binding transcriptional regulator AlpA